MSGERIVRTEIVTKEVTVPEGHVVCRLCKGKGRMSKYDQGWRSIVYDSDMDAPAICYVCNGLGYVPKGHYGDERSELIS